ncbi:MAG: bifunctional folylpolyglutamate synthase/dihydrofolate synthase [Alphaproteobacteria bacterium]|nr:bifunctional folylpolyglutamate synthase/dihydrofolate synthase [Alphaproteobacteria bacterium]
MSNRAQLLIDKPVAIAGIDLTLTRFQALLDTLGNPELHLPPTIHVAGTNGKGSTIAFLRAMLEAAGKRVHVYTSPHLVRSHERVLLAGREVEDDIFCEALEKVAHAEAHHAITVFERITAAAFLCFAQSKADYLLLETGMGGRLDATNVTPKILTLLTPIAMDHMEYLGNSITKIASEKAAIMRPNVPCISAPQSSDVEILFKEYAGNIGAPLSFAVVDKNLRPNLSGAHQYVNASVAVAAARYLNLPESAIQQGVGQAYWPARLQKLTHGPLVEMWGGRGDVMLDGGHNTQAAEVLADWARHKQVVLVCGMMRRKSAREWMGTLAPHVQEVICMPIQDTGAFSPEELAEEARIAGVKQVCAVADMNALCDYMKARPVTSAHVLVAGSLYLAGEILKTHG